MLIKMEENLNRVHVIPQQSWKKKFKKKKRIPLIGDAGFAHFFYLATFLLKKKKPTVLQKEMTHHISHPEKFTDDGDDDII